MSVVLDTWHIRIKVFLISLLLGIGMCTAKEQLSDNILARVVNKEITVEEFMERSELTVRPNKFKDKRITLNNLIIEKVLALEAQTHAKQFITPMYQNILKGIKEQSMRERLFNTMAVNKVKLDSSEILHAYTLSKREYELEFFTIKNRTIAKRIKSMIDTAQGMTDEIFQKVEEMVVEKPVHKVNFLDKDDDLLHNALYTDPLKKDTVIGPLELQNGNYIVMKVLDWNDKILFGGEDEQIQWNEVKDKLYKIKTSELWRSYQMSVMKGKKIEFDKNIFNLLSEWAMKKYLGEKKEEDSLNYRMTEVPLPNPNVDMNAPFFSIDNKVWTIKDFKNEVSVHPLVYFTTDLDSANFKQQFELAVLALMKDHYLTREAYKKHFDKDKTVKRAVEMWKDSFLADDQAKNIVESALTNGLVHAGDNVGKLEYWESYLRTLQRKYSPDIQINYDAFNKISITKIDMVAWYTGVPYPMVVPNFPFFYSSPDLDYVHKVN